MVFQKYKLKQYLDMRLKTLSGLQREKIEEEYNELMKLIAHLKEILASETLVYQIIKEEMIEIKEKFGDERKTKIVAAEGEIDVEDLIKEEQSVIALTHFGQTHHIVEAGRYSFFTSLVTPYNIGTELFQFQLQSSDTDRRRSVSASSRICSLICACPKDRLHLLSERKQLLLS